MKKRDFRAIIEATMLPRLPGFVEADATAIRWPPTSDIAHYFSFADCYGTGFEFYVQVRPLVLPAAAGTGRLKRIGTWQAFDPTEPPANFLAALDDGVRYFEHYSTPSKAAESLRIQVYGTWEQTRELGFDFEPTPSSSFFETFGVVLLLTGADEEAREALQHAQERNAPYLDATNNKYSRAAAEERQARLAAALDGGISGLEALNPRPADPVTAVKR
jgi:hypothetical protein